MTFAQELLNQVEELKQLIKEQNDLYEKFQTKESKAIDKWHSDHHRSKRKNKSSNQK